MADVTLWQSWQQRRDEHAFRTLVAPHLRFATDLARRAGCSAADADDAVQECLARLAQESGDKPVRVGLRAWLGRAVRLQALMQRRTEARRKRRQGVHAARRPGTSTRETDPRGSELPADEVSRALAQLSDARREAVVLRFLHDLEYREVAAILGISENACRLRVHKAVADLRRRLGREPGTALAALPLLTGTGKPTATLVAEALTMPATASLGTLTLGGLIVSKTLALTLAVAVLAVGTFLWLRPDGEAPDPGASSDGTGPVVELPGEDTPTPALEGSDDPEVVDPPTDDDPVKDTPPTTDGVQALARAILEAGGRVSGSPEDLLRRDPDRIRWVRARDARDLPSPLTAVRMPIELLERLLALGGDLRELRILELESDRNARARLTVADVEALARDLDLMSLDVNRVPFERDAFAALRHFTRLERLHLGNTGFGAGDMKDVAHLHGLELLDIGDTDIDDASLKHLQGMRQLRELRLGETAVTDAGLQHLAPLRLETLDLEEAEDVTGEGLAHMDLTLLKRFTAEDGGDFTDATCQALAGAHALEELNLEKAKVTDAGVAHLASLRHLKRLDLDHTRITAACAKDLARLTSLDMLSLDNTPMDDSVVPHLSQLTNLTRLDLSDTRLTDDGIARLRTALPRCRINAR